jgi:hypothetical protein
VLFVWVNSRTINLSVSPTTHRVNTSSTRIVWSDGSPRNSTMIAPAVAKHIYSRHSIGKGGGFSIAKCIHSSPPLGRRNLRLSCQHVEDFYTICIERVWLLVVLANVLDRRLEEWRQFLRVSFLVSPLYPGGFGFGSWLSWLVSFMGKEYVL